MGALAYTFSSLHETRVRILQAIPNTWQVMTGSLLPSPERRSQNAEKVIFDFSVTKNPVSTVELGIHENKHEHIQRVSYGGPPNLGSINFVNQPEYYNEIAIVCAKSTVIFLLEKGYGGVLNFAKSEITPADYSIPARCVVAFDYVESRRKGTHRESARIIVNLAWDEGAGGRQEDVSEIIKVCSEFQRP